MQIMWVLKVLFGLLVIKAVESKSVNEYSIALPGCQKSCGYVKIPYPFGIGSNCSMNEGFAITCNYSSSTTVKPYLANTTLEVLGIALTGQIRISSVISSNCSSTNSSCEQGVNLSVTPFVFSADQNRFTATGCDNFAILVDYRGLIIGGCLSMCNSTKRWLEMHPIHRLLLSPAPPKSPVSGFLPRPIYSNWVSNSSGSGCYGINCCQMTIPPDIKSFKARMGNPFNDSSQSNGSISSFMVEQSWFEESLEKNGSNYASQMKFAPAVLDWGKWKGSCDINSQESEDVFCTKDYCWKKLSDRFLCVCSNSSLGDNIYPIATEGCKGKSECLNLKNADCGLLCMHTPGSSNCAVCPDGYRTYVYSSGQITCFPRPSYYDGRKKSKVKFVLIGCGSGLGSLLSLMGMWWLYKIIKRRKETKLKQKFFKRNGGLLLEQQLSSTGNNVERTQLFTSRDLEKATDHYNTNRILGQGGQGTVYKGMLTDGKIVAVKKSTLIDEHEPEAFINEVVILSQVNHRNVVKLLGCCLETQVPLLVYEFIPNGTLFQYIHDPSEEFPLTWKLRLRIATEVSGALSYLHSAASMPIYHRDIKSTNILLDEKYRSKVSDFGISRAISIDQTHLTTKVQGTRGYLDPEYFQSSQFTDKSDVYSFGVVLVELLTGQKPISYTKSAEPRSLAIYFLESMEENRLLEILDERVLKEGGKKEIIAVAGLAKRCLNLNGKKRPLMKTIAVELERLRSSEGNYSGTKQDYEEVDVSVGDMPAGPWESTSTSFGSYSNGFSATNVPLDVDSLSLLNTR